MDIHLQQLQSLDLTNSGWLSNHSLQAICKCDLLQRLILKGCRRLGECFAYTALATRFGFKNISWLDLRDTSIGDNEVPCFSRLPKITHLFLGRTASEYIPPPAGSESNGLITDRGIISMCLSDAQDGNRSIQELSLVRTDITDRCLLKIAGAFPIKQLDIRGCTKVTEKGLEAYKLRRPTCNILH